MAKDGDKATAPGDEVTQLRARAAQADTLEIDLRAAHESNRRLWEMTQGAH